MDCCCVQGNGSGHGLQIKTTPSVIILATLTDIKESRVEAVLGSRCNLDLFPLIRRSWCGSPLCKIVSG